jgi:hypothetical protein
MNSFKNGSTIILSTRLDHYQGGFESVRCRSVARHARTVFFRNNTTVAPYLLEFAAARPITV